MGVYLHTFIFLLFLELLKAFLPLLSCWVFHIHVGCLTASPTPIINPLGFPGATCTRMYAAQLMENLSKCLFYIETSALSCLMPVLIIYLL